jgi:predicted dehydrogenase
MSDLTRRLLELNAGVQLVAIADPDEAGVRQRLAGHKVPTETVQFYPDAKALLAHADDCDGIMIGTRCSLHADVAVQAAETKRPILLEKPVGISHDQLEGLTQAFAGREDQVLVCFPLRFSPLFQKVSEIIDSGRLGTISVIQAVNNVPYGGVYFATWYRSHEDTGGLWLQKATHDLDCVNAIVRSTPVQVAAMTSRNVFTGDKPYDLRCSQCPDTATCPESPENLLRRGDTGGMAELSDDLAEMDHWCVFSRDIRHEDAGSALIRYANGLHACYSQNFVTRRSAARRGGIVTGYRATLDYDFPSSRIRVIEHHTDKVDRIDIDTGGRAHFGGDLPLLMHFVEMMRDGVPSLLPLQEGLISAAMCLAARESAAAGSFRDVRIDHEQEA